MATQQSISVTVGLQPHVAAARDDDFAAVATLFAALHSYNASLDEKFTLAGDWQTVLHDSFVRTSTSGDALWLLAWQGQEPVGLLVLEDHRDSLLFEHRQWVELVALYVVPSHRKTGLSQQLLAAGQSWTVVRGFNRMQLYVTTSNERARAFYRRCGWRPVQEIWRIDVGPCSSHLSQSGVSSERKK